jgi:hypothetical protein
VSWKVDILDRHATEPYFLARIAPDCIPLPQPTK